MNSHLRKQAEFLGGPEGQETLCSNTEWRRIVRGLLAEIRRLEERLAAMGDLGKTDDF